MILFYFLVNVQSIRWLAFDTEMKLISACNICFNEVEKMIGNFSHFSKPLNNSSCANANNSNIYCTLIKEIHEDIISRYEEDIPSDYCSLHGPCIYESPSYLEGPNCAHCLNIITFVFEAKKENRESTLKKYCSSSISSAIQFCNGVEYLVSKSMKKQFLEYQSATDFCVKAAFCHDNLPLSDDYSDL